MAFLAVTFPALAGDDEFKDGQYILVRYGENVWSDPEVVSLTKNTEGEWTLGLKIEDLAVTSRVDIIRSGEYKKSTEMVTSAIARVPASYNMKGDASEVTSHKMYTLTLHGNLEADGVFRGVFAITRLSGGRPSASQGTFVLKPLEAQQDVGEGRD